MRGEVFYAPNRLQFSWIWQGDTDVLIGDDTPASKYSGQGTGVSFGNDLHMYAQIANWIALGLQRYTSEGTILIKHSPYFTILRRET